MYRPLSRFLQQFGYDPAVPLNPILLFSIVNKYYQQSLQPCVNYPDMFYRNCEILAYFFRTGTVDVVELAQHTFNFVAKRSNSPDATIVRVLKNYEFDISDYKRLLFNGVLFNLIIHSFQSTFSADFDILLKTYVAPKTKQQVQSNLKIGLHFIGKLGCYLVQYDDFQDPRVVPFALYYLGQVEHLLKGFVQFPHQKFEFADSRADLAGSVTQLVNYQKNCVLVANLVSWRGTLQILYNLVFSCEQTCIEIAREEILEVQKQGNAIILISKGQFSGFPSYSVKFGFLSDSECAEHAQLIVQWIYRPAELYS